MEKESINYNLVVLILGLIFIAAAFLPRLLAKTHVSFAMVCIAAGILLAYLMLGLPRVDPVEHSMLAERLSEITVIVTLMGVGLKLDTPFGWRAWRSTWRLLAITMPLCIALLAIGGAWAMGLTLASAVLLGGAIAPTDPVLAAGVQVGPPGTGDKNEVKFALTSEAGLNDGLAFPFVNLAIVLSATGFAGEGLLQWLAVDVLWKIFAGVLIGGFIGRLIAIVVARYFNSRTSANGLIAIALTLLVYGLTELAYGYGFIGVFVAAVSFRHYERDHKYHKTLYDFSEQIELLFMSVLLILFGVSIAQGLFEALTFPAVLVGLAFVFVVRPATGMLGLVGSTTSLKHKAAISWFGIRGIGTFYYLAHGLNNAYIEESDAHLIWASASFIILVSIILHGVTTNVILKKIKA